MYLIQQKWIGKKEDSREYVDTIRSGSHLLLVRHNTRCALTRTLEDLQSTTLVYNVLASLPYSYITSVIDPQADSSLISAQEFKQGANDEWNLHIQLYYVRSVQQSIDRLAFQDARTLCQLSSWLPAFDLGLESIISRNNSIYKRQHHTPYTVSLVRSNCEGGIYLIIGKLPQLNALVCGISPKGPDLKAASRDSVPSPSELFEMGPSYPKKWVRETGGPIGLPMLPTLGQLPLDNTPVIYIHKHEKGQLHIRVHTQFRSEDLWLNRTALLRIKVANHIPLRHPPRCGSIVLQYLRTPHLSCITV